MSWVAAAIAASSIGGALISSSASRGAAETQAGAADRSSQTQMDMFRQNKADLAPWMTGGNQGLNALLRYLGVGPSGFDPNAPGVRPFGMQDFITDPSYQWRLGQGEEAIMANRAASGGIQSGRTLKDLMTFGQGMASQEYGNAFNRYRANQGDVYGRLAGLSDTGVNAAGGIARLGASAASQVGENQIGAGNALAAGQVGSANAIAGGIGGAGQSALLAYLLNQPRGGMPDPNLWGTLTSG